MNWARENDLDIVFNMVRFTDPMLGNQDLADKCQPIGEDEAHMREFFLDRVRTGPLLDGQNYIHMHYADMIANGYHRLAPCPFQTQGIMVNPDPGLFFCENSEVIGNVRDEDPETIYFLAASQKQSRAHHKRRMPNLSQPLPDERVGAQADRALREVSRQCRPEKSASIGDWSRRTQQRPARNGSLVFVGGRSHSTRVTSAMVSRPFRGGALVERVGSG